MSIAEETKAQWDKVKTQGPKAILSYYKTYYLIPTIVVVLVVSFIIYIIYTSATSLPYGFYGIMLNATTQDQEAITADFIEFNPSLDPETEDIYVDATTSINPNGGSSQYEIAATQKVATVMMAGEVDVLAADYTTFASYAMSGNFYDLREILSAEQISRYEDHFYYVDLAAIEAAEEALYSSSEEDSSDEGAISAGDTATDEDASADTDTDSDTSDSSLDALLADSYGTYTYGLAEDFVAPDPSTMEEPIPIGIILTDSAYINDNTLYPGTIAIIGIPANAPRMEVALSFIDFLFQ